MVNKEIKKRIIKDLTGGAINSLLFSPFFITSTPPVFLGVSIGTFGLGIAIEELKRFSKKS